ncbi:MAG: DapH/DapD/GlmU-related protein [Hydrogenophaga sp.]|uniref:DapH/DapD/GlmU-related protein n=1 Tax=Hydrogenophaga sp. TaxID=1904254 RepID=UPI003D14475E
MKIYLLGAANPETIRMIVAVQRTAPNLVFAGFLDNDPVKKHTDFYGYPVLGGIDLVPELIKNSVPGEVGFVNLITGNLVARYETSKAIIAAGGSLTNFIHPSVELFMSRWGSGNYIQEGVIVQAGVTVGDNSSIHMGALIGHESTIGNTVFIAHAVSVSGCCEIGDGTFIGTNATLLPRIKIGKWATIGAGALVNRDVPDYSVAVGNPARVIKRNEVQYGDGRVY